MEISKSKLALAQLVITAGVKELPESGQYVTQDGNGEVCAYSDYPSKIERLSTWTGNFIPLAVTAKVLPDWDKTILTRAEFEHVVNESRTPPVTVDAKLPRPSLDYMIKEYRAAVSSAEEQWREIQKRAKELGVEILNCRP